MKPSFESCKTLVIRAVRILPDKVYFNLLKIISNYPRFCTIEAIYRQGDLWVISFSKAPGSSETSDMYFSGSKRAD